MIGLAICLFETGYDYGAPSIGERDTQQSRP